MPRVSGDELGVHGPAAQPAKTLLPPVAASTNLSEIKRQWN